MTETVSYTPEEVAKILKISRFTVYEMIKRGDLAAYRIGRKVRVEAPDLDIYIKNSKSGSMAASASEAKPSVAAPAQDSIILCGQDGILDILARHLGKEIPHGRFLRNYIGSIDGLLALYHGTANAVTAHLWDGDTDTYNAPYVRRFLPGHRALIINLAYRMEGFYVHKGNPKNIMTWEDLTLPSVRLVNRERGSGARVLLDEKLRMHKISHDSIAGYEHEEMSHLAVASSVARGEGDVGVGIEKVALQVQDIDFVPLQKERYDLIIRREDTEKMQFQVLLSILRSQNFRNEVQGVGGYDLTHTGQILAET